MEQTATYTLRPVQETDEALLLEIYASTRADEMALVPWDAAQKQAFLQMQFSAQQKHYRAYFPQAAHEMILIESQPVGRLYVDRRDNELRILDVTLLPQTRGRGIGTQILLDLMKEADQGNRTCSIYVESFNRSLGLFQRLGFVKTEENGALWLMKWRAGPQ
jgi:ribosomal protein S18 acetylase RimI-like enzyme